MDTDEFRSMREGNNMNFSKEQAAKGLRLLFWAAIVALFSWIPLVGIVAAVLNLYALYTLSTAAPGYKTAFYVNIISLVITVISMFFKEGFMAGILSAAVSALSFLSVYFICSTTASDFLGSYHADLVSKARMIWMLYAVCTVVMLICKVLIYIPLINIGAALLAFVVAIVQIVAGILYLVFLWKSQKALSW